MKTLKKLAKTIPRLIPDVLALTGAGAISYGVMLIYVPAGWIVGGILLVAAAVIWSKGGGAA